MTATCLACGVPIAEHPLTDTCAIQSMSRDELLQILRAEVMRRDDPVPVLALVELLEYKSATERMQEAAE